MRFNGIQVCIVFGTVLVVSKALLVPSENDEFSTKGTEDEYKDSIDLRKRGLSVRGDLRALARMLRFQQDKRRQNSFIRQSTVNPSHKKLIDLGKRNGLNENDADEYRHAESSEPGYSALIKRGRLSINGALQSLSDMLASSGRNRLSEEVSSNKNRLLGLGK